jgi:predicted enzyme related to lactoylglutathione lyase
MATLSRSELVSLIPIRNMNRAIKFYTKKLGAKLLFRGRGQMRNYWATLRVGGTQVWFVAPDKREKRTLSYHTFLVKNIKSAVRDLQRQGVKFQRADKGSPQTRIEGPIAWEPFGGVAFFKDSEGNLMMVWQNIPPM